MNGSMTLPTYVDMRRCYEHLVEENVRLLQQARTLLLQLDDHVYTAPAPGLSVHRVGGHLRHIIEFYECFLNGLSTSRIDYNTRPRDQAVATMRSTAARRLSDLIRRLPLQVSTDRDGLLWVRMEQSPAHPNPSLYFASSIMRELQALNSHTTHHLAIISLTLQAHGVILDSTFGMAPSTLVYRAAQGAAACAQ